jgi:hypothetical protein
VLAYEAVWIFGVTEQPRLDDAKRRRNISAADIFDGSSDAVASSGVIVERENDRLDAVWAKPGEDRARYAGTAGRGDVRVAVSAELMHVDQALDQYEFATLACWEMKNLGQSIGRERRAACSSEIEVTRRGIGVLKGTSPERSDTSVLVPPGSAESPGPAAVRDYSGLRNLELGVTRCFEGALCEQLRRDDAHVELVNRVNGEAANMEICTSGSACLPAQLAVAQPEEVVE